MNLEEIKCLIKSYQIENKKIPSEIKIQIIEATEKIGCNTVAKLLDVNKSTISRWRNSVASVAKPVASVAKSVAETSATSATHINSTMKKSRSICSSVAKLHHSFATPVAKLTSEKKPVLHKLFQGFLLIAIIATTTFLLISEAKLFYSYDGQFSLIKAIILEVIIIYISFFSSASNAMKIMVLFILVSYSAYTVSGKMIVENSLRIEQRESLKKEISELEKEIVLKDQKIGLMLKLDRVGNAMKADKDKTYMLYKLGTLRDQMRSISGLNFQAMISLIFFRIILLCANIYFTHCLRRLII